MIYLSSESQGLHFQVLFQQIGRFDRLGNQKRSRNRMYSRAGEREKKYGLTRLISERAAISDPTGVMYPDILCSQTQTIHLLTTMIQTVTAPPNVHEWDPRNGNLLAPPLRFRFRGQRFDSKLIIDVSRCNNFFCVHFHA